MTKNLHARTHIRDGEEPAFHPGWSCLLLFTLKKETSARPEGLRFQLTYISFARARFHRLPVSREPCLSLGNMSCNQRCIHPHTSADSHAGAMVRRGLTEGGSGQVPGENFSLHKSDCPVVALCKDGRVLGGASHIARGPEGARGLTGFHHPFSKDCCWPLCAENCRPWESSSSGDFPSLTGIKIQLLKGQRVPGGAGSCSFSGLLGLSHSGRLPLLAVQCTSSCLGPAHIPSSFLDSSFLSWPGLLPLAFQIQLPSPRPSICLPGDLATTACASPSRLWSLFSSPAARVHACMRSRFSHIRLCDTMDYSPPGSLVRGILQARILEWVAIFFSRGSSRPRYQTHDS